MRRISRVRISADIALIAVDASSCAIVITDATQTDHPITYVNAAFTALTGYTAAEVIGRNCRLLQGPDTDPQTCADIRAALAAGTTVQCNILNYRKDGTSFWNDLTIDPMRDADGRVTNHIAIQHATDPAQVQLAARAAAEARFSSIVGNIPGYVYRRILHADGTAEIPYVSPPLVRLLGLGPKSPDHMFRDAIHAEDREDMLAAFARSAADLSPFQHDFRIVAGDGTIHWLRSDAMARRMPNGDIVWDGLTLDMSAEHRWAREVANQPLRDPLTGLLTRAAWRNALDQHLHGDTPPTETYAILHVDIKGFGALNLRLGQATADELLCETARRLTAIGDTLGGTVARLGGDEFALLIPDCRDRDALSEIADDVRDALAAPIMVGGQAIAIRTCIGATLGEVGETGDPVDPAELTMRTELALRWAKQDGPDVPVVYSHARDDRFHNQTVLEQTLEQAIANDELELHYQPLVDLASGRIVSAEALVRWRHPILGMQRPDLFIPLAEKMGLIGTLGHWVIVHAMRQHRAWQDAGLNPPPIAINVSGLQLLDPGFVALVEDALRSTGADATHFEFELTEGMLIEPSPLVMTALTALRTMGFRLAIDDFGSGHATFRYLREFPVDKLKIDQIFVRKLVLGSTDALIIRAIISLARSMGLAFVAEGIETRMQRDFLEREGCPIGQGYLFSMPLLPEDFGWMLANDVRLPLDEDVRPVSDPGVPGI